VVGEHKAEAAAHEPVKHGAPEKHETGKHEAPAGEHHGPSPLELGLMALSVAVGAGGIFSAYYVYSKRVGVPAQEFAQKHHDLYDLVLNKYKVDELYDATIVQSLLSLNETAGRFDNEVIDGTVNGVARMGSGLSKGTGYFDNEVVDAAVNAAANATQAAGRKIRRLQTGNIKDYLTFALVGGLFVIAAFCLFLTWPNLFHMLKG
jgi:NADH-quinone oxidoreductase subunit L